MSDTMKAHDNPTYVENPDDGSVPEEQVDDKEYSGPLRYLPEANAFDIVPDVAEGSAVYSERSLGYLHLEHPIRQICIYIKDNPLFDQVVMFLILANCVVLAQMDPTKESDEGRNKLVEQTEPYFTGLFTVEMVIKIVAMGFVLDDESYLKDGWNLMDFLVVVASLASSFNASANVSALRTIRVLRPLRTLSSMPGMRCLVATMLKSIPMLANVVILSIFLFMVFGILGLQLFMGALRNRCMYVEFVDGVQHNFLLPDEEEQMCTNNTYSWPGRHCDEEQGFYCLDYGNPNYGVTSFDNIFWAFNTIFQCITLEGWTPIMYWYQEAVSGWAIVYFIVLIFIGGFFMLNLALAVVTDTYGDENEEEREEEARKEEELNAKELYDSDSDTDDATPQNLLNHLDEGEQSDIGLTALCRYIINQSWFNPFMTLCIMVNTVLLAMEYDGQPQKYADILSTFNLVLTIIFAVEMVLKVLGEGIKEYCNDRFNCFDGVVVLISLLELALASSGSLSALRAFRILRVMKLIRSWTSLQDFLLTVFQTIIGLGNFTFIVTLTIFIFALLGMQMFGGKMGEGDERPRHHFDTLLWAAVTVFQILTGEDWNAVMYDAIKATNSLAALYFVAVLLLGNFMVLNLFVAILLTNFGEDDLPSDVIYLKKKLQALKLMKEKIKTRTYEAYLWIDDGHQYPQQVVNGWRTLVEKMIKNMREESARQALAAEEAEEEEEEEPMVNIVVPAWKGAAPQPLALYKDKSLFVFGNTNPIRKACFNVVDDKRFDYFIMCLIASSSITMAYEHPGLDDKTVDVLYWIDVGFTITFGIEMLMKIVALGLSLSPRSYFRSVWNIMDCFIVFVSVLSLSLSSIDLDWVRALRTLRVLRPLRVISRVPELKVVVNALFKSVPGLGNVLFVSLLFWLIFGILGMELFMGKFNWCNDDSIESKDMCHGEFIVSEVAIRRWVRPVADDQMDVLGQISSLVGNITSTLGNTTALLNGTDSALGGNASAVVDPAGNGLEETINAVVFGGACTDPSVEVESECWGYYDAEEVVERVWETSDMNFNNVLKAMQTLFEMSTTEGWTAVMYDGVDSVGKDMSLKRDHNELVAFFFIVFMVVGNFFILNLFIGIILDNFAKVAGEETTGTSELMTKEQRAWVKTHHRITTMTAKRVHVYPESAARKTCYKIVETSAFEYGILSCIIGNALFMCIEYYQQPKVIDDLALYSNIIFTIIFCLEAMIKIFAMYPMQYFKERWNMFDFVIVCVSVMGLITGAGAGASALRILRIARLFRIARTLKGLKMLFQTLVVSIPSLCNVGGLLVLLCFVYAILGVSLFGKIKYVDELTTHANFRTFGNAMLTLLRMSTGEAWNSIMYSCMVQDDCDESADCAIGECCGLSTAPLYFISFVIVGSFVMLNLLIAVVLENFSDTKKEDDRNVTDADLARFKVVWQAFDPGATEVMNVSRFPHLVQALSPPLGLSGKNVTRTQLVRFTRECKLDVVSNFVQYHAILQALTARAMEVDINDLPPEIREAIEEANKQTMKKVEKGLRASNEAPLGAEGAMVQLTLPKNKQVGPDGKELTYTVAHMLAVKVLQAAVRGFLQRKKLARYMADRDQSSRKERAEQICAHLQHILLKARISKENGTFLPLEDFSAAQQAALPPASSSAPSPPASQHSHQATHTQHIVHNAPAGLPPMHPPRSLHQL